MSEEQQVQAFPAPETEKLPIYGPLFVVVKKRLTMGEERLARRRLYVPDPNATQQLRFDPTMGALTTVMAYLVDWNLTQGGQKVEVRALALAAQKDEAKAKELQELIEGIDSAYFDAIHDAIKEHEKKQVELSAFLKKSPDGKKQKSETSELPSEPAGASNTSEASPAKTTN